MKKALLALLLVAMVLGSGCLLTQLFKQKAEPKTPEEKAVRQVEVNTTEGKLLSSLQERFEKTGDCTVEEYRRVAGLLGGMVASEGGKVETDPEKSKEIVDTTKACAPVIHVEAEKQEGNLYRVTYWGEVSEACPLEGIQERTQDMRLAVEVDNVSGTAKVIEGKMDAATKRKVEGLLPGLPLMGNCAAAFILGSGQAEPA